MPLSNDEKLRILQETSLFTRVPEQALESICRIAHEHDFSPGDVVMREGETGDALFVIVDGELEVLKTGTRLRILDRRDTCVGEMALIDDLPRSATITARTVIVSGGADPITPPQHARDMAAGIPDAVHWHVPRAGHMLPGQAPDVITAAIKDAAALGAPTARTPRLCTARNVSHAPPSPPHLPPAPEPASAANPALFKYVTEGTQ